MTKIRPETRWIEIEMSCVDQQWYAIFPSKQWEENAYEKLIQHRNPDQTLIKPEVINNMVELVTHPHKSIESAQKQASSLMELCTQKSKEMGMVLSKVPWTKINKDNIPNNKIIEYCVTPKDYYLTATKEILSVLKNPYDLLWAGCMATHIHMSAEDDEATLLLFKAMSNYASKLRQKWAAPQDMYMSPKRYHQWNKIIEARKKIGHLVWGIDPENIPEDHISYIYQHYFDEEGNLKRMHNIIAIKKPGERLTVELRSPDWVTGDKQLWKIIDFTKYLVQEAICTISQKVFIPTILKE